MIKKICAAVGIILLMIVGGCVEGTPKETEVPVPQATEEIDKIPKGKLISQYPLITTEDLAYLEEQASHKGQEEEPASQAAETECQEEETQEVAEEPIEEEYQEVEEPEIIPTEEEAAEEPVLEEDIEEGISMVDEEEVETGMIYLGVFDITAYEWTGYPCANGNYPSEGYTVACNSLPLGTTVYIEGIGYRVVEDRGADWHADNWMDLYLGDVDECYQWGIRSREVYVVE